MNRVLVDDLVFLFSLIYYAFLVVVYLLRARELSDAEMRLGALFSAQLIPFGYLWVVNVLEGDRGRIVSMAPIIVFLLYDFWYRLITRRKPVHHPDRWPVGLVVYLVFLFVGCIGLNWYGFLVSDFRGNVLVASFFVMMGSFGDYQVQYRKRGG